MRKLVNEQAQYRVEHHQVFARLRHAAVKRGLIRCPIPHIQDGPRTRRVQSSLTVAPDESMVSYLRSMLGSPQAVWTE